MVALSASTLGGIHIAKEVVVVFVGASLLLGTSVPPPAYFSSTEMSHSKQTKSEDHQNLPCVSAQSFIPHRKLSIFHPAWCGQ